MRNTVICMTLYEQSDWEPTISLFQSEVTRGFVRPSSTRVAGALRVQHQ